MPPVWFQLIIGRLFRLLPGCQEGDKVSVRRQGKFLLDQLGPTHRQRPACGEMQEISIRGTSNMLTVKEINEVSFGKSELFRV